MAVVRTLSTRYAIEPDHRIGWTSANWDRFADENGAPELASGGVVGRPLWGFVAGSETRMLYEAVFERVTTTGDALTVPFRCDSPGLRRFMQLRIAPQRASDRPGLELVAELLREEPRSAVDLLDETRPRAGEPVGICSFCKRVHVDGAVWMEVEDAVERLDLLGASRPPPLSHRVCPRCEDRVRQSVAVEEPGAGA